jgi:hypothetical protein
VKVVEVLVQKMNAWVRQTAKDRPLVEELL